MTIHVENHCIHLIGCCPVEDAELLLTALQDKSARTLDLSELVEVHTAVAQILAACDVTIVEFPGEGFALDMLLPAIGKIFPRTK